MRSQSAVRLLILALLPLAAGGCVLGPHALERTHGRYAEAVRTVEEKQTLANIVHVRYEESPLVLNINAVTSQFDFSASAEARPFFSTEATSNLFRSFSKILPFAQAGASSRPTFSFDPATDGTAMRQYLTPISADALFSLIRNEPRLDVVLRLWIERMNEVPNRPSCPSFRRATELFQLAREHCLITLRTDSHDEKVSGPLPASAITAAALVDATREGLHYEPRDGGKSWMLLRRVYGMSIQVAPGAEASPILCELWSLLGLKPGLSRYQLRTLTLPAPVDSDACAGDTVNLTVRATAKVYRYLASAVEVPAEHLASGVARPMPGEQEQAEGIFRVHAIHARKPPPNAFVFTRYRDCLYYIDDSDVDSKATLTLIMQLSRLDFKRQQINTGPVLTLPAGP